MRPVDSVLPPPSQVLASGARILAASDIHIGRIPSLPDTGAGVNGRSAWEAVVRCALDRRVDALLLAGDVVEQANAWFEAYGALLEGLERLAAAGIRVIAVAGNHDAQVLPRLARDTGALTLLGQGGGWEATDLGPLRIVGWSFPERVHLGNPLASFPGKTLTEGRPFLGLLHCDLDGPAGSRYAPVPGRDLEAAGAERWVLGHVHKGGALARGRAFYCGSAYALDAGEEGEHGAWLLRVDAYGHVAEPERIPLSPWRFATLPVDVDGTATVEEAQDRIAAALQAAALDAAGALESAALDAAGASTLYCSLRFEGACGLSGSLGGLLREGLGDLDLERAGVRVRPTGRILDATDPLLDLESLARERGILGSLARLLLQVQDPQGAIPELPEVLGRVLRLHPGGDAPEEEVRATLALAVRRLLLAVHAQERQA